MADENDGKYSKDKELIVLVNEIGEVYKFETAEEAVNFLLGQGVSREEAEEIVKHSQEEPDMHEVTLEEMAQILGTTLEGIKEILDKDYIDKTKN